MQIKKIVGILFFVCSFVVTATVIAENEKAWKKVTFSSADRTFSPKPKRATQQKELDEMAYFKLGETTLDKILTDLKNKNNEYTVKTGGFDFTIIHKYQDYLDAPYTIVLVYEDILYGTPAQFKLFFTPKSKLLYRVEIEINGSKDKFLKFFEGIYLTKPKYSDACYNWLSKPDAAGECFYNVLFCTDSADCITSLYWTDWDQLYGLAVLEGMEIRGEKMGK